jgi:hypothetical protein
MMKRRSFSFLFAALASLASAGAQSTQNSQMVPVAGMAMQIVGRELGGIDCQSGQPTGFGTADLWYPYIAGIPTQYLFKAGATVRNETTAVLTSVFPKVVTSQTTNDKMTDVYLQPHLVYYYYHPNTTPKDWTDFDSFQAGQLVGILSLQMNMFSVVPQGSNPEGLAYGVNSGPWTYTANFTLPDGEVVNLANFTEGITVHIFGLLGTYVSNADGSPVVVNLTNSQGPVNLGSCAVMVPFSGPGVHSAAHSSNQRGN